MIVSEVKSGDIQQVYEFCMALKNEGVEMSFADVSSINDIQAWVDDTLEHLFALYDGSQIIALVKAKQGGEDRMHSAFMSAAVSKKRRGEGLIQIMSPMVYSELKDRGIKIARAYVYSNNHASVSAVLKDGFSCTGAVHMHHFDIKNGEWIDDMIFQKIL